MDLQDLKDKLGQVGSDAEGYAEDIQEKAKSYWWLAYVVIGFVGLCSLVWALTR